MQLNKEETTRILNNNKELLLVHQKVVDKLEQRIATLEKVLASHAKCIGEMREKKDDR
jgi:F420-0:gamma-glutamyl ligase